MEDIVTTKKDDKLVISLEPDLADMVRELASKRQLSLSALGRNLVIDHLVEREMLSPDDAMRLLRGESLVRS